MDNRFTVQMPFRANFQKLGDTYVQAKRRFLSLERRLHANDNLKQDYTDFVNEFITLQHLENVPEKESEIDSEKVNFLPHHCVHKEDSTTMDWLAMPSDTWQKTPLVVDSSIRHKITEEERNRKPREDNQPEIVTTSQSTTVTQPIFDENVYSTMHKLFRVIATVKTAISRFKKTKFLVKSHHNYYNRQNCTFSSLTKPHIFTRNTAFYKHKKNCPKQANYSIFVHSSTQKQTPLESEDDFRKVIFLKRRSFQF